MKPPIKSVTNIANREGLERQHFSQQTRLSKYALLKPENISVYAKFGPQIEDEACCAWVRVIAVSH
jgi:hypothetical protein